MSIRALIVDDEPLARRRIRALLREEPDVEVVGECANGETAVHAIRERAPELVFLDVQMPAPDGFGVLEALGGARLPLVVFVTAYDEYAVKAFEVHALDYLLKPFDRQRFKQALDRARTALASAEAGQIQRRLLALVEDHAGRGAVERLVVRSAGRISLLRVDEIDWIEAESNYVRLHVRQDSHLLRDSMAALEARLGPAGFRRIHRSAIVNLDRIRELRPSFRGDYVVLLRDGTRLTLSRTYRDRCAELLGRG